MTLLTKENLSSFLEYYHWFHDSSIDNVLYDLKKDQIVLYFSIFWSGKPTLKMDGTYETNKTVLKMVCNTIYQYNYQDTGDYFIEEAYLKYVRLQKEECLCFATDKENPSISLVCKNIFYEEE